MVEFSFFFDGEVDGGSELIEVGRVEVYREVLGFVDESVGDFTFSDITDVEFKVFDGLQGDGAGFEDFHFIFHSRGVRHRSQTGGVLEVVSSSAAVFVFDEQFSVGLVDGCRIAQVNGCQSEADDEREHEPFPVENQGDVESLEVQEGFSALLGF